MSDQADIETDQGRGPSRPSVEINYLTATHVRQRYGGISDMTLWRWLQDETLGFPQPTYIKRRRYWGDAQLDAFDAQHQLNSHEVA